jgi:hypothetical protein
MQSGYNNSGGIDQANIRLSRDLHCLVAVGTYNYTTGEYTFNLGIKAFPSAAETFGIGRTGAAFESYFGERY